MAPALAVLAVVQPQRLRGHRGHGGIEVENDQDIALKKALVADVPPCGSEPVATRQVPLPLVRGDAPHGQPVLDGDMGGERRRKAKQLARRSVDQLELAGGRAPPRALWHRLGCDPDRWLHIWLSQRNEGV